MRASLPRTILHMSWFVRLPIFFLSPLLFHISWCFSAISHPNTSASRQNCNLVDIYFNYPLPILRQLYIRLSWFSRFFSFFLALHPSTCLCSHTLSQPLFHASSTLFPSRIVSISFWEKKCVC